jgi:hypothetical protein
VKEIIRQVEEDITRLSGAGDIQSIVHMEQPTGSYDTCELAESCAQDDCRNAP